MSQPRPIAELATTSPLVLLSGCPELSRPLRVRGYRCASVRNVRHLLNPREDLEARAIVIAGAQLEVERTADFLEKLRATWPLVDVLLWSQRASPRFVREALNAGAKDVLLARSAETCSRQVAEVVESQQLLPMAQKLDPRRGQPSVFEGMVSRSRRMWDVFETARQVGPTDATVLILGETGTGKELLARAIHRHSGRQGPFVGVNCGAVAESLIDSELFGHARGAFTGAVGEKAGLFRHAENGTLMLDEVGNVPLQVQYRLLRTLQEGSVRPVGAHSEVPVNARVISATSSALESEVLEGRFREDLFYRLDVIRLEIPPLRKRREDIVYMFGHFARQVAEEYNLGRPDLEDSFLDALVAYDWPGNVRQLQNVTERLILTQPSRAVSAEDFQRLLPFRGDGFPRRAEAVVAEPPEVSTQRTLAETIESHVERVERGYLQACLRENAGAIEKTARQAGISRRTLLRRLNHYGIDKASFRRSKP